MKENIIEKINNLRKLMTSSNVNEAAAAAKQADKLINQHRISEQELNTAAGIKEEEIFSDEEYLYESGRAVSWKINLAIYLSRHYSCYIFNQVDYNKTGRKITRLKLTGTKSDIEILKYMFTWLVFEIERLNLTNKGKGHIICNSFCEGAVRGIQDQLLQSKREVKDDAYKAGHSQALEKIDHRIELAENLVKSKTKLKKSKASNQSRIVNSAFDSGREAGKNIHLGKVISGKSTKLLKE